MAHELALQRAGTTLIALGERALHWPHANALMIADLHLGKADVFRRAGIAVPRGGTAEDLQRLDTLVQATQCLQLWILGDVLHGPLHAAHWLQQWVAWRAAHPTLQVHLLCGNHDRRVDSQLLQMQVHEQDTPLGPFLLRHEPGQDNPQAHVLCGHLHPQAAFNGMARRWPAFWLRHGMTVLPAFSRFTAGIRPDQAAGDQLLACVQGELIALPVAR